MAQTRTRSEIRDAIRLRADQVNSTFWTDTNINDEIDRSAKRLYNFLIRTYGDEYYVSSATDTTVSGTQDYALPADFYKLLGVELQQGGGSNDYFSLPKFSFAERNTKRRSNAALYNYMYRLHGSNVKLIPPPAGGLTLQLWYVPVLADFVDDTSTIDTISGFEEWLVLDVVEKILTAEESDTSTVARQKADFEQHIIEMATPRDANAPEQVVDVETIANDEFWGFWAGR